MTTYEVVNGTHYYDGKLHQVGDIFAHESPNLATVFSTLRVVPTLAPPEEDNTPELFVVRHVVTNKWGVYAAERGELILKRYVTREKAHDLAFRANHGTLTPTDTEVSFHLYEALYGNSSNR